MFNKILLVCVGNICRSPMAAFLFRTALADKGYSITSAGVAALVGEPMDPMAHQILEEYGFEDSSHRAVQLTRSHVQDADLILVMDKKLIDEVLRIGPEGRGKTFTLGRWQGDRPIPDPYKQSHAMFEHTFVLIHEAVGAWIKHLN
ncbi:MAG TPA: low molecular weight protein-tyrosine-phosphatase [Pseudomonadales bacterium]|nr:low molecular weight protein-tyrosine-phosphatase [Pseudomonadales bacterium]